MKLQGLSMPRACSGPGGEGFGMACGRRGFNARIIGLSAKRIGHGVEVMDQIAGKHP
jgi:hypothetical protein